MSVRTLIASGRRRLSKQPPAPHDF